MKDLKDQVEYCLTKYPETRNSDIKLTICVWYTFENITDRFPIGSLKELTNLMLEMPREDNIKRIRAQFNQDGKYWPTDLLVAKARRINETEWRIKLGYNTQANAIGESQLNHQAKLAMDLPRIDYGN